MKLDIGVIMAKKYSKELVINGLYFFTESGRILNIQTYSRGALFKSSLSKGGLIELLWYYKYMNVLFILNISHFCHMFYCYPTDFRVAQRQGKLSLYLENTDNQSQFLVIKKSIVLTSVSVNIIVFI